MTNVRHVMIILIGGAIMFNKTKLLVAFGVCFATSLTSASTITWTTSDNSGAADIAGNGFVVSAMNGGPSSTPGFTVAGVDFTSGGIGSFGSTWADGAFRNNVDTGDEGMNTLLGTVAFGGTPGTITANGLLVGAEYTVQIYYTDRRGQYDGRTIYFDDNNGNAQAGSANARGSASGLEIGQHGTGTFVATSSTETFTVTGSWDGVDMSAFLLRETNFVDYVLGDANLDGTVTLADYDLFVNNFNTGLSLFDGDVDRDGDVDFNDYLIIEAQYPIHNGGASLASAIPEPASLMMLGLGSLAMLKRHK